MAEITTHVGRTSDHYKVKQPPDQKPRTAQRRPDEEPQLEEDFPDDSRWSDERRRQERGNRGPGEEPGFGQGA